jgi:hypothetical protein
VQGALYGARALATGTGPLLFAAMFSAFTKSDSPLPYFPGAPFLLGTVLMTVAIGYSLLIDNRCCTFLLQCCLRPFSPAVDAICVLSHTKS